MFDSLQLGKPRPGRISTAIGGEVSVVVDAAACAFFDDYMLARALPLLLRRAGRFQAARSCKAAVTAAVVAHQGGGHLQAARAVRLRASGSSGDALRLANGTRSSLVAAGKMRM